MIVQAPVRLLAGVLDEHREQFWKEHQFSVLGTRSQFPVLWDILRDWRSFAYPGLMTE